MRAARRMVAVAIVGAVATLVVGAGAGPVGADPTLTVPTPSVEVGGTLSFTATECSNSGLPDNVYQHLVGGLVSGSGAGAVRAGVADTAGAPDAYEVVVQGWVDPDEAASLVVRCRREDYRPDRTDPVLTYTDYPPVAIDVTPAGAPVAALEVELARTTAAGGQVVVVTGAGCLPDDTAIVVLREGDDLTLSQPSDGVRMPRAEAPVVAGGTFRAELELNRFRNGPFATGPLPEGPYVVEVVCDLSAPSAEQGRPQLITVTGSFPSDSLAIDVGPDGHPVVSGEGCSASSVSIAYGGWKPVGGDTRGAGAATPGADGRWTFTVPDPTFLDLQADADCGDPTAAGFRYAPAFATLPGAPATDPPPPGGEAAPADPVQGQATFTG